jgi:hypothetical protein
MDETKLEATANIILAALHKKSLTMPHRFDEDEAELEATANKLGITVWQLKMLDQKLEEVCSTDEDGFAVYEDGWDDERVDLAVRTALVAECRQIWEQELRREWEQQQFASTEPLSPMLH